MKKEHRMKATVDYVKKPHDNDHGGITTWVGLDIKKGMNQGFGGLMLNEALADDYVRDLCAAFGVRGMDELVGKECYALYAFSDRLNIEGLESVETGRRFLHNTWRKKHFPNTKSLFEQKQDGYASEIVWAERRAQDARERLSKMQEDYFDWETAPAKMTKS